ncbi:MAG: hypothetical protein RLZZ627_1991, partial [Pseudomonadota bacterium]
MIDEAALSFGGGGEEHFLNDFRERRCGGFDGAGQGIAAQGPEADGSDLGGFTGLEGHALVIDHDEGTVSFHDGAWRCEIERDDWNVLKIDVLPDIELGPVRQRENANTFAFVDLAVVDIPKFRTLVFGIPAVIFVSEGVDPLLGARLFLITPRTAEGGIELILVQGLFESLGLHDVGMFLAAMGKGADALFDAFRIDVDDEVEAKFLSHLVAKGDHFAEFPGGIDVEEREGRLAGVEGLHGEVQHDRGVLADGVEHDGAVKLSGDFSDYMDALSLKLLEVG